MSRGPRRSASVICSTTARSSPWSAGCARPEHAERPPLKDPSAGSPALVDPSSSRRILAPSEHLTDAPTIGELKICGLAAVRARFQRDAGSILRLYFDYPTSRKIGVLCKALAITHKIYRCVEPPELEKVAGTVHHGGIVAVVPATLPRPIARADLEAWAARREPLLVLDRIGNAHNLGALARSAAFFGIPRLILDRRRSGRGAAQ